jgi:hypothetical protein
LPPRNSDIYSRCASLALLVWSMISLTIISLPSGFISSAASD